jgi:hypothetical protein
MVASDQKTADIIKRSLKTQGWCFVTCGFLGGEVVAVSRDTPPLRDFERDALKDKAAKLKNGQDKGVVCYTLSEFLILCESAAPQLIHETKRLGATITESDGF